MAQKKRKTRRKLSRNAFIGKHVSRAEKTNCKNRVSAKIRKTAGDLGFNVSMKRADKLAKQACTIPMYPR